MDVWLAINMKSPQTPFATQVSVSISTGQPVISVDALRPLGGIFLPQSFLRLCGSIPS